MVPRLVDENTLCFLSPSNYHIDICKKRYLDLIENTLSFLTKKSYNITFEAKEIIPDSMNEEEKSISNELNVQTPKEEYSKSDDSQVTRYTRPNLSTIGQPLYDLGQD